MGDAKLLQSRSIYPGRVVRLVVDEVELPNGHRMELEVVRHVGAAAVLPIDADGTVVLIRQYRWASSGWLVEAPAGKLDPGESPETCARREMQEEVGLRAGRLEPLGVIWTTPGFSDERIWLYAGLDLQPAPSAVGVDEVLEVQRLELRRAIELAEQGDITDAKTACALLRARRFLR